MVVIRTGHPFAVMRSLETINPMRRTRHSTPTIHAPSIRLRRHRCTPLAHEVDGHGDERGEFDDAALAPFERRTALYTQLSGANSAASKGLLKNYRRPPSPPRVDFVRRGCSGVRISVGTPCPRAQAPHQCSSPSLPGIRRRSTAIATSPLTSAAWAALLAGDACTDNDPRPCRVLMASATNVIASSIRITHGHSSLR